MNNKTKDEQFIIQAYEMTLRMEDPDVLMDRYEIGSQCGLSERSVNAIFKLLKRSNFVRNFGEREMSITEHGRKLAIQLLQQK